MLRMTKLQKIGLIMAIVSAVLWLVWLFAWLYDFWNYAVQSSLIDQVANDDTWIIYGIDYFIYYVLIVIFAVWIGLILEEFSRKSLKKSLILLIISCLFCWLFWYIAHWFSGTLCWWCDDYIAYGFWIFSLLFFVLLLISVFFIIKFLIKHDR